MELKDMSKSYGDEEKKKKNFKPKSVVSEVFSDYCSSTSIHGIGYLGAEDKTLIEKIWWILVFVLSLIACTLLIGQTWTKWKENPVVVTFATEQYPVWDVPFPAVTICPLSKIRRLIYDYTYRYNKRKNLTGHKHKKFWDLSLICNLQFAFKHNANETTDEDVIKHIKEVAPKFEDNPVTFKGKEYFFMSPFSSKITSEGLCFTFNSLGRSDMVTDQLKTSVEFIGHDTKSTGWTVEDGYPNDEDNSYPERSTEGVEAGLHIIMHSESFNRDMVCGDPILGFKVLLHNPAESPRVSHQYILAPINKEVVIGVNPKVITTSKGLINIPPKTRNCYFSQEKKLRFFKVYTQNNCKVECKANITKIMCNCLPFYAPRDNDTIICVYAKTYCTSAAKQLMLRYENMIKKEKVYQDLKNEKEFSAFEKCSCLPACASLDYEYQTSAADYDMVTWLNLSDYSSDLSPTREMEVTHVKIFFQDSHFLALHRNELYGQTDFLANIGGLLGLFMGFSFLSFLEIIYFITLRMWCKLYYRRKLISTSQ